MKESEYARMNGERMDVRDRGRKRGREKNL